MTTRDVFKAAKIRNRMGLKIYLMNRSSCLLLNLFCYANISLISEAILVLLKKKAAGCLRN